MLLQEELSLTLGKVFQKINMLLLSALTKFFTSNSALHSAIINHEEKTAIQLIKQGVKLNGYYQGWTPLQLSLTQQMPQCAPLLLENGADPNAVCNSKYALGKTIQFHTTYHKASNVKLLALYGAKIDDINFTADTLYLRQLILDKNSIYRRRKELEEWVSQETNPQALIKIYEELKRIWANESKDETEATYKAHYEQKADACQQKIIEITAIAATSVDEKDKVPIAEQELTPLLLQPSSNLPKLKLS